MIFHNDLKIIGSINKGFYKSIWNVNTGGPQDTRLSGDRKRPQNNAYLEFPHKSKLKQSLLLLLTQQPLSVKAFLYPLVSLASGDLWITPHSRIVSPTPGGTVHLGLEPIIGMLFESYELTTRPAKIVQYIKSQIFVQ